MKIAIISLGGKSSKALAKVCKKYFTIVDSLDLRNFEVFSSNEGIKVMYNGKDLPEYDCIYIRGSYKYSLLQKSITTALNKESYMPLDPNAFSLGHDKFMTLLALQKASVAVPKTYYAPTAKLAKKTLKEVHYPVIMKVPEGTHGKGVMIADSYKSAITILDTLEAFKSPFIIQEFVATEETSDIRAIVSHGTVLAAYRRIAAKEEIRANIHSGGTRKPHKLTKEERRLAVQSAKAIGSSICGVDIFHSKNPSVIEVNLSPALEPVKKVTGVDVLDIIAKDLYEQAHKFQEKRRARAAKKIKKITEKNGKANEKVKEKKPLNPVFHLPHFQFFKKPIFTNKHSSFI